jgi:general L-amino acid transport system ATP-binding protein
MKSAIGANSSMALIQFDRVSKFYGSWKALDSITLSVSQGERIVICGPSGSGKSTLIRCINGLEEHDEGSITVAGQKLESGAEAREKARRKVGMVFQQFNLFPHLSVLDNCTLALEHVQKMPRRKAIDIAMSYLERVQIPEQAEKFPGQLSGGQQQRVAIARALCLSPEILLFDEPTSALDPEMIKEVLDVMVELAKSSVTMVCVTHEMGFARQVASRIVFMDRGAIVESAAPEEFFSAPKSPRTRAFLDQILKH